MACVTLYVRQNAPITPRLAVGSSCLARRLLAAESSPGTCGHWLMSFQSP